jgi:hypothetical protein
VTNRAELEQLPSAELHDRATRLAWRRLDVSFLWHLLSTIPEARAAAGEEDRSEIDIMRPLALLNDLVDADRGELADALRPLYIDYLDKHTGDDGDEADDEDDRDEAGDAADAADRSVDDEGDD